MSLAVIISDVHLGSPYSRQDLFTAFLAALPDGATLVLNGDTVDGNPRGAVLPPQPFGPQLEAVRAAARRLAAVVWIPGNHHGNLELAPPGVTVQRDFTLPGRLYAIHGDNLHRRRLGWGLFTAFFYLIHEWRIRLGCEPMHVSAYARRWRLLYRLLCRQVEVNAAALAREQGFGTVVCGHVHSPADRAVRGVRYLNTGCWLDGAPAAVLADAGGVRLRQVPPVVGADFWE